MNLKVIIIDDEANAVKTLENFLRKYLEDCTVVDTANSASEAVKLIDSVDFDLALLDINLGDGSGFDVLDNCKKQNFKVVFTTAYDQYAIKAFKYSAMDYLLKPINPEELMETVERIKSIPENSTAAQSNYAAGIAKNGQADKLVVNASSAIHFIQLDQISHLESYRNYTDIYLIDGQKITSTKTLKYYEVLLEDRGFFRIHQKHLVSLENISRFLKEDGGYVQLKDGSKLEVSRRKKDELLKTLMPDQ